MVNKFHVLCVFYLNFLFCFCQKSQNTIVIEDSIRTKSIQDLYKYFIESYEKEPNKAKVYARAYIEKGKTLKSPEIIAQGYDYMTYVLKKDTVYISYLDSLINTSLPLDHKLYPAQGFLSKGNYYYNKRSFKDALDNYILANKYARKNKNERVVYLSNYSIGILKNRVGEHSEALRIFRQCYNYSKFKKGKEYRNDLFALVTVLYKLKKLDSASYYNKIGINEALKTKDFQIYNYFVLASGVTNFYKKKYPQSIDSLKKSIDYLKKNNEIPNLLVSYYYLGKNFHELKMTEKAMPFFIKLDSLFQIQKDLLPETRDGYELLINYYKKTKNIEKELEYTQKLVQVDSVLNGNYKYLLKGILKDYDASLVVSKKDKTISSLKNKNVFSGMVLIIISLLSVLFFILFYLNFRKRKYYKKKFDILIRDSSQENSVKSIADTSTLKKKELSELNIAQSIIDNVLSELQKFEKEQIFTNNQYTLNILAKELNTNSTYLSKIINVYKDKNFSSYINDLRIDYAVQLLKDNKKFRNYSIKSIAEEVGFKNSESFSKAFLKKTGIYPSYFIKKL